MGIKVAFVFLLLWVNVCFSKAKLFEFSLKERQLLYGDDSSSFMVGRTEYGDTHYYVYGFNADSSRMQKLDSVNAGVSVGVRSSSPESQKRGRLHNNYMLEIIGDDLVEFHIGSKGTIESFSLRSINRPDLEAVGAFNVGGKIMISAKDRILLLDSANLERVDSLGIGAEIAYSQGNEFAVFDSESSFRRGKVEQDKLVISSGWRMGSIHYSWFELRKNEMLTFFKYWNSTGPLVLSTVRFDSLYLKSSYDYPSEDDLIHYSNPVEDLKAAWNEGGTVQLFYVPMDNNAIRQVASISSDYKIYSFAKMGSRVLTMNSEAMLELWDLHAFANMDYDMIIDTIAYYQRVDVTGDQLLLRGEKTYSYTITPTGLQYNWDVDDISQFNEYEWDGKNAFAFFNTSFRSLGRIVNGKTSYSSNNVAGIARIDSLILLGGGGLSMFSANNTSELVEIGEIHKGSFESIAADEQFIVGFHKNTAAQRAIMLWRYTNPSEIDLLDSLPVNIGPFVNEAVSFNDDFMPILKVKDSTIYYSANDSAFYALKIDENGKIRSAGSFYTNDRIISMDWCNDNILLMDGTNEVEVLTPNDTGLVHRGTWIGMGGGVDATCTGNVLYGASNLEGFFRHVFDDKSVLGSYTSPVYILEQNHQYLAKNDPGVYLQGRVLQIQSATSAKAVAMQLDGKVLQEKYMAAGISQWTIPTSSQLLILFVNGKRVAILPPSNVN